MTRLCKTAKFQQTVFKFIHAFLPDLQGAMEDTRFILTGWNCVDEAIIHSSAMPIEDAADEPGVPVGLLPFVLEHVLPADAGTPQFTLFKAANEMLCHFWAAVDVMRALGKDATLAQFPEAQCIGFAESAKDFVLVYVRYTHPNHEDVKKTIDSVLPAAIELLENPERRPSGIRMFLKIKTLFFGLHGYTLSKETIGKILDIEIQDDLEQLMHDMSAAVLAE